MSCSPIEANEPAPLGRDAVPESGVPVPPATIALEPALRTIGTQTDAQPSNMKIAMAMVRMVSANPKLIKKPEFADLKTLVVQYDGKPGKRKVMAIDQRVAKKASGAACAAPKVMVPLTTNLSLLDASRRHDNVEYVYDVVDHPELGSKLNCQQDTAPARYAKCALPLPCCVHSVCARALVTHVGLAGFCSVTARTV